MEGSPCTGHAFPVITLSFFLLTFPSFISSSSGLSSLFCKYFNKINSSAFWHKAFSTHSAVFRASVASLHLWVKHNKIEIWCFWKGLAGQIVICCFVRGITELPEDMDCCSAGLGIEFCYGRLFWSQTDCSKPFPTPLSLIYLCSWKQSRSRFQGI